MKASIQLSIEALPAQCVGRSQTLQTASSPSEGHGRCFVSVSASLNRASLDGPATEGHCLQAGLAAA